MEKIEMVAEHLRGGLTRYIEQGVPPGGFLTAVLCNDLKEALGRADHISRDNIFDLVGWLYNYAPAPCWGSKEKFDAWIAMHAEESSGSGEVK